MKPEAYERTLKARAFDVARYLLPLATNTSLGQIVNARTLETQVSRLLSHPVAEVRELGAKLREAATGPAWNVNPAPPTAFAEQSNRGRSRACAPKPRSFLTRDVRTAPTLVKYAAAERVPDQTRTELAQAAHELLGDAPVDEPPWLIWSNAVRTARSRTRGDAALLRLATIPTARSATIVASIRAARISEIIDLGLRHRGHHDEALRAFHAGAGLRFDILMDIGGFRDMHRHRRCTQIIQGFTAIHGYETPSTTRRRCRTLAEAGIAPISTPRSKPPKLPACRSQPHRRRKRRNPPCTCFLWPRGSVACSKWISPRRSTSANCVPAPPATSAIAAWHGRCIWNSSDSIHCWPNTCGSQISPSRSIFCSASVFPCNGGQLVLGLWLD